MAPRIKKIPYGDLTVDPRVQRTALIESTLDDIRSKFDPQALRVLEVSERADGTLVIIDGWHRWTVVCEMETPSVLDCKVHRGLDLVAEADLFEKLNDARGVEKLDKFHVRITKEEDVALAIARAAKENGWTVGKAVGQIRAVDALDRIYLRGESWLEGYGETLLYNTILVVTKAWLRNDPKAVDRNILLAIAQLLLDAQKRSDEDGRTVFDQDRLSANLAAYLDGPGAWLTACRSIARASSKTLQKALRMELFTLYHKGPGGKKLPQDMREL